MTEQRRSTGEEGYLLIGLVVTLFLLVLVLGVAAPRVAKALERERELESEHRALEYVRAIQLYYRRNGSYPSSVEQLTGTGTAGATTSAAKIKYLRQAYKDPLTGDEFRLIRVGEAQTQVKGFFGEALQGMPQGNLGSVAGMQSNLGGGGATGSVGGATGGTGGGFSLSGGIGSVGATGTTGSTGATGSASNSTDATSFKGSKGAFMGVGSNAKGHGLVEWNGSENIEDWEFLYDPRVEILKQKVSLFGGSPAAAGTGSFGSIGTTSGATGQPGGSNGAGSTLGASPAAPTPTP